MVFIIRRFLFAFVIGRVADNIVIQIMWIDGMSMFILCYYFCVFPLKDKINNGIQIFNEIAVLLAEVSLLLFTNYVPDPLQRYEFGQGYIYFIGGNVAVNLCVLVFGLVAAIIIACRRYYFKRQSKRAMKLKVAAL